MNRKQRRAQVSGKQPRADSSSKALAEAIQLHRQGQLDAAETLYRQTLARNPRQIDALHFLGVLLSQRGRHSEGAESIRRALDIDPNYADAWNNLGNVRAGMDRWDEAAEAYQRFGEAAAAFQQAIVLAPSLIEAHFNLGKALSAKGRYDEAIAAYQEVIRLQPTHAMAYRSRGILLYRLERSDEAAAMFRDWLALDPANPVAKHMLAAHSKQDVPERAADNYVQQLFDGMADSFDDHLHRLEYRAPELVAAAVVTRVGRPEAAFNVLDAGCGTGLCGPSLRPYARRLVGVDLSPRMVERARSRGDYDEVAIAELTAFLIDRPAAYDLIVSADTLVYFGQLEPVLTATAAALRPEGWLAFTVEQVAEQDAPAGFDLDSSGRYQHSEAYLRRVLAQVGLLVESLDGVMLRLEAGRYVNGFLVMARKPALRTDDQNSEEQFD